MRALRRARSASVTMPPPGLEATHGHAPLSGDDHDASRGRAHDLRGLAPVTILPPGLEPWDEWERRAQHREACIAAVKRSGDYGAVAQHFARPVTPDPRKPEVSKRAWEKWVRGWRMDLKALARDGLAASSSGGAAGSDDPLRVHWPSEPMYIDLPDDFADAVIPDDFAFGQDVVQQFLREEPLHVPWRSEQRARARRRIV